MLSSKAFACFAADVTDVWWELLRSELGSTHVCVSSAAAPRFIDTVTDGNMMVCVVEEQDDHHSSLCFQVQPCARAQLGGVFMNRSLFAYRTCLGIERLVLVICTHGG